jgi:hypothetical protein
VLFVAAVVAGTSLQAEILPALEFNFVGQLLALAVTLAFVTLIPRVNRENTGLSWRWSFGRLLVPAIIVVVVLVALNVVMTAAGSGESSAFDGSAWEAWLYQATLPGVVEEIAFRGVLLALLDQAFPPRWRVGGVLMGWGAVIQAVLFTVGHLDAGLLPALFALLFGLAAAWLRYASGSVWPGVFAHNATNTAAVPFIV